MSSNSENATRSNSKRRRSATNKNDRDAPSRKRSTRKPRTPPTRRQPDRNARRSPGKVTFELPAPPVDDPHKLLGSRLEPIMTDLASQPNELQTSIIEQLNSMLDLRHATQQRKESMLRFDKPVPAATIAGQDESSATQRFIPNSVRLKNPINSSKNYKDDERIKNEEEETQREHEEWQVKMAARAKKRAQLEIDLRIEDLKKAFYDLAFDIAASWHTVFSIRRKTKAAVAASSLSENEFSHLAVHKIISDFTEPQANVFGFKIPIAARQQPPPARATMVTPAANNRRVEESTGLTEDEDRSNSAFEGSALFQSSQGDDANNNNNMAYSFAQESPPTSPLLYNIGNHSSHAMAADYLSLVGSAFSYDDIVKKLSSNDKSILFELVSKVSNFLVRVTLNLWESIDDKDEAAKINAALKAKRRLKLTAAATEQTSQMLSDIDLANPPKELDDYIDKRHKRQIATLRRELKNEMRKNCSGDRKNQRSTPDDNGAASKKLSKKAAAAKQKKKKKNKEKEKEKGTRQKKTNQAASRAASNKGGNSRGAKGR